MYFEISAELRLNSIANNYPRSVNKKLEDAFRGVRDEVVQGHWITALEQCEKIVVNADVTQAFYDRIHLVLSDYISKNY